MNGPMLLTNNSVLLFFHLIF